MTIAGLKHVLTPSDPRHGTRNGYDHYGCRCARCTKANTISCRRARAMRDVRKRMGWKANRRGRGRSEFEYPISIKNPGAVVRHRETGRHAVVVERLPGGRLLLYADALPAKKRRPKGRPIELVVWRAMNVRVVERAEDQS